MSRGNDPRTTNTENPRKQESEADHYKCTKNWQGQKGSNPRPTVLETVALPAELYP